MWECAKCKSEVEDNFDVCWNCGNPEKGEIITSIDNRDPVLFNETNEATDKEDTDDFYIDIKSLEASVKL